MNKFAAILAAVSVTAFAQNADIEALKKELQELRQRTQQLEEKIQKLEAPPVTAPAPSTNAISAPKWSPTAPQTVFRAGPAFMNISADALVAAGGSSANDAQILSLQPGGHDPIQRGFTLQGFEVTFEGAVDPFLSAQANLSMQLNQKAETSIEVEEAWAETMSLPGNVTIRAGQMFAEFGRQNSMHAHAWNFVDSPLVNARLLGPDALRGPGVRASWLAPTPFYSELMLGLQNSAGENADGFRSLHDGNPFLGRIDSARGTRGFGDMLFTPRYLASFDLTRQQTLVLGASAAIGPNSSGPHEDTRIYGADLFWKWKPSNHSYGFPFVTYQTEAMLREYRAGALTADINGDGAIDSVPRELLKDWGFYSQLAYGFHKGWVAALRFDYVDRFEKAAYENILGDDPTRTWRWRISPDLTWYPSEFSKVRLQYNLDDRGGIGIDHSVWLEFEFLLGAHGAHKF